MIILSLRLIVYESYLLIIWIESADNFSKRYVYLTLLSSQKKFLTWSSAVQFNKNWRRKIRQANTDTCDHYEIANLQLCWHMLSMFKEQ